MWKKACEFKIHDCLAFKPFPYHEMVEYGQILDIQQVGAHETRALLKTRTGRILERRATDAAEEWLWIDSTMLR